MIDIEFQDMLDNLNPTCEKCRMSVVELRGNGFNKKWCDCDFFKQFISHEPDVDIDTREEFWGNGVND